jgi:hypothetical protein
MQKQDPFEVLFSVLIASGDDGGDGGDGAAGSSGGDDGDDGKPVGFFVLTHLTVPHPQLSDAPPHREWAPAIRQKNSLSKKRLDLGLGQLGLRPEHQAPLLRPKDLSLSS